MKRVIFVGLILCASNQIVGDMIVDSVDGNVTDQNGAALQPMMVLKPGAVVSASHGASAKLSDGSGELIQVDEKNGPFVAPPTEDLAAHQRFIILAAKWWSDLNEPDIEVQAATRGENSALTIVPDVRSATQLIPAGIDKLRIKIHEQDVTTWKATLYPANYGADFVSSIGSNGLAVLDLSTVDLEGSYVLSLHISDSIVQEIDIDVVPQDQMNTLVYRGLFSRRELVQSLHRCGQSMTKQLPF